MSNVFGDDPERDRTFDRQDVCPVCSRHFWHHESCPRYRVTRVEPVHLGHLAPYPDENDERVRQDLAQLIADNIEVCPECGPRKSTHVPDSLPLYDHRTHLHGGVVLVYPRVGDRYYPAPVCGMKPENATLLEKGEIVRVDEAKGGTSKLPERADAEICRLCKVVGSHKFTCPQHSLNLIGGVRRQNSDFSEQAKATKVYRYLQANDPGLLAHILGLEK